uniref:VAN3-binding protein-like auxin canalisation domain-containing protein n=1 Tax=Setaria digitata TaxID=48799 RepID=A0A915Q547_9BILA
MGRKLESAHITESLFACMINGVVAVVQTTFRKECNVGSGALLVAIRVASVQARVHAAAVTVSILPGANHKADTVLIMTVGLQPPALPVACSSRSKISATATAALLNDSFNLEKRKLSALLAGIARLTSPGSNAHSPLRLHHLKAVSITTVCDSTPTPPKLQTHTQPGLVSPRQAKLRMPACLCVRG